MVYANGKGWCGEWFMPVGRGGVVSGLCQWEGVV